MIPEKVEAHPHLKCLTMLDLSSLGMLLTHFCFGLVSIVRNCAGRIDKEPSEFQQLAHVLAGLTMVRDMFM